MKSKNESLFIYTMTRDSGFAPHVNNGWISLACCAGPTRKHTEIGDYVLGVAGATMKDVKKYVLLYLMKVDEKMTFDEYFHDSRFIGRVDNIYVKTGGKYVRNTRNVQDKRYTGLHRSAGENDTKKSEFVLLSRHFYYFGNYWRNDKENRLHEKAKKFCDEIGFTYARKYTKMDMNDKRVKDFLGYISDNYSIGENGKPNHLPDNNQKSKCHKPAIQCQPKAKTKGRCY